MIYFYYPIVDIIGSIDDKIENNEKIISSISNILSLETNKLIMNSKELSTFNEVITESKEKIIKEELPYSIISTGKVILQTEQFNKDIAKNTIKKYKLIQKNYFIYNPSRINIGSIGKMYNESGCVSPIYVVFKTVENYTNFIEQYIKTNNFKIEVNKRCSGSVRQALNFDELSKITIPIINSIDLLKYNDKYNKLSMAISVIDIENKHLNKLKQLYLKKFFG